MSLYGGGQAAPGGVLAKMTKEKRVNQGASDYRKREVEEGEMSKQVLRPRAPRHGADSGNRPWRKYGHPGTPPAPANSPHPLTLCLARPCAE